MEGDPQDQVLAAWLNDVARLRPQVNRALATPGVDERAKLCEEAMRQACALFERMEGLLSFNTLRSTVERQDRKELGQEIAQLRVGHLDIVVMGLTKLLDDAHLPGWELRPAITAAISRLLVADPTTLVGSQAASAFADFRQEVCDAVTTLHSRNQRVAFDAVLDVLETAAVAAALAAVAVAAAGSAPVVVIAGSAAVAVTIPAAKLLRWLRAW